MKRFTELKKIKLSKGAKIALAVSAAVLVLAASVLITATIMLFDPTDETDEKIREADLSLDALISRHIVCALDGVAENESATIRLNLHDINEILYALTRSLPTDGISVRSAYIERGSTENILCIPIRVLGIKSTVRADFTLREEDGAFAIRLYNVKLGRVKMSGNIISLLGIRYKISSSLTSLGAEAEMGENSVSLKISREALGAILERSMQNDEANRGLVMVLYNVFMLDTDSVTARLDDIDNVSLKIDLSRFGTYASDKFSSLNAYTSSLLVSGEIRAEDIPLVSKYYVNGFTAMSRGEQEALLEKLGSSSSYSKIASHNGLVDRASLSLSELILSELLSGLADSSRGFRISDTDVNKLISELELIGTVWQFCDCKTLNCAYVIIRSLSLSFGENTFDLIMELDINGCVLTLKGNFNCPPSGAAELTGTLKRVSLGEYTLAERNKENLYSYLAFLLKDYWISPGTEPLSLTINIPGAVTDNSLVNTLIQAAKYVKASCKSNTDRPGGYINIELSK